MKYMGSKRRIAKHILPVILNGRKQHQWYVEPFVGGANIIDKVEGNKLGADCNYFLIECLKQIRDDFTVFPKDNTEANEELYKHIRKYKNVSDALYGYYGFALSYGGKWFGGWRRDNVGKRDYVSEAYRNVIKQSKKLQDVNFVCCDYYNLKIPNNSIIYCDPPYANSTRYKNKFDHDKFWGWCIEMSEKGHSLFVSEYTAPDCFSCLWSKKIVSSLTSDTGSKHGVEKLFMYKGKK